MRKEYWIGTGLILASAATNRAAIETAATEGDTVGNLEGSFFDAFDTVPELLALFTVAGAFLAGGLVFQGVSKGRSKATA